MAALFVRCLLVHAKRHQVRFPLLVLENKDFNAKIFFLKQLHFLHVDFVEASPS